MVAQRVHADAVAQQGATAAATCGVHGQYGDADLGEGLQEAQQQLVDNRRLSGAAGASKSDHRRALAGQLPFLAAAHQLGLGKQPFLDGREHLADADLVVDVHLGRRAGVEAVAVGARDQVVDHPGQAHLGAVVGVVDVLDALRMQHRDLFRRDGAAAAAEHADVAGAALGEHVHHVLEELVVAALVAGQGDAVGVLLQRGAHDVFHRAVVAQVDHLGA